MHINSVLVDGFWCHYNIESVNNEIMITASFVGGQEIQKIHKVNDGGRVTGADMVAKLLDDEFAKKKAKDMIESANRSTHSPFRRG